MIEISRISPVSLYQTQGLRSLIWFVSLFQSFFQKSNVSFIFLKRKSRGAFKWLIFRFEIWRNSKSRGYTYGHNCWRINFHAIQQMRDTWLWKLAKFSKKNLENILSINLLSWSSFYKKRLFISNFGIKIFFEKHS